MSGALIKNTLSKDRINSLFKYSEGVLYWKEGVSNITSGTAAGSPNGKGHLAVQVSGKLYRVHNLIWIMHNDEIPEGCVIDHIDNNCKNNRIENLRVATLSQNNFNSNKRRASTSKYKGVHWNKQSNSWRASIRANGKALYIGNFKTEEEAHEAWCAVAKNLHGEFFRAA